MKDYLRIVKHEESNSLSVCFYIEQPKVLAIGNRMNEMNENAYMNGYNWEAFLNRYLALTHPAVLEGMGKDPEAGMYVAYYKMNSDNEQKANQLVKIIEHLVENESDLFQFLQQQGNQIEWD